MATSDLGRIVPLWKGAYSAEETYELNDVVQYTDGSTYWHHKEDATTGVNPTDETAWVKVVDASTIPDMVNAAENAKKAAETASTSAQTAKTGAETAKTAAETAKADAVTARKTFPRKPLT